LKAKVYFASFRAGRKESWLNKLERLFYRAGLEHAFAPGDLVAIKVHFGERGNLGYVRPQFAARVVQLVKKHGGKPFLTDANTLYVGSRSNAVDHLQTAIENGFDYAVVGAPLVIADGLNGKDYLNVTVNLKHFREVKIASAAYHADALIAITHFKGHEATGFGGTLKNIGMGLGSRSGKQMMHSDLLPKVDPEKCTACARCTRWCPTGAIRVAEDHAVIDERLCQGCGECTVTCPSEAIAINWKTKPDVIQEKIVEYTVGVLQNKEGKYGFVSFLTDVSPDCDCWGWNDAPIVRNIGMLASRDPVALDQACLDLVNREAALAGSRLEGCAAGTDKFRALYPRIDCERQLAYAEEVGLGTRAYELIEAD
jgi:uncharacterized Fe-S center protein